MDMVLRNHRHNAHNHPNLGLSTLFIWIGWFYFWYGLKFGSGISKSTAKDTPPPLVGVHAEPSIILDQTRDNGYKSAPIIWYNKSEVPTYSAFYCETGAKPNLTKRTLGDISKLHPKRNCIKLISECDL